MRSLRRTLSVRFSLTMFVALLVIALWAFLGAQRVLRRDLDRALASAGRLQSAVVAAGRPVARQSGHRDAAGFIRDVNRFVALRDRRGAVLDVNTPLASSLPVDTELLSRAAAGTAVWTTHRWGDVGRVRSVYLAVAHERAEEARIVQVAASLGPLQASSRQMLLLLLGTVVLGTVATVIGGGWLSRSVMAPVAEIADQAEGVLPGAVGQRITAHAQVEEFNRMVTVLNRMLERLDQGLLSQRRIIGDVGHDLRTPITALRGEVEVTLRHQRTPERYEAVLRSVLEEVNHLGTLSETLLLLARIEAGDLAPNRVSSEVETIVASAVQRVRPRVGGRQLHYQPGANGAAGTALLDGRMLGLVLDHLLDNAVRHTPPDTSVTVRLCAAPDAVDIAVEDDGEGVPDDALPHLFERFYRGDSARGRGAGAGLGLTVAAAIVQAHGGTIQASRAANHGLRVTVRLPRNPSPAV